MLHLGMNEELTKSLGVRIKWRAGTGDITVGVCYRPPDQEDEPMRVITDNRNGLMFPSHVSKLLGEFNHPDIC